MSKRNIGFLFGIIFSLSFLRCATIGAPEGGPKDSLAPTFLISDPLPFSVNYKGKKATLTFDEYIQLKDQQKLFFMSPPATKKPILSIRGKSVVVEFQEPLDSNATYRLDFGSSIVDNNEGNKMDNFSIVFSTGSTIDSLIMAGQVIDAYSRDTIIGAFMFYFDQKADSVATDSTMFKARAEALFRSDSSGYFVADILKDKQYRVYALADANDNQLYEAGTDKIAFLDSTFNPIDMPNFSMAYDEVKKRWQIDSLQTVFEVFKEIPVKRQTLIESKRPMRNKFSVVFNARNTIIDTLKFDGIDESWLIKSWNPTKDTLSVWVAPDTKEQFDALTDTIRGRIAFQKHDSVWNLYSAGQNLTLAHKIVDPDADKKKKEQQKQAAKEERVKKRSKTKGKKGVIVDTTVVVADSVAAVSGVASVAEQGVLAAQNEPKKDTVKAFNPFKVTVKAAKDFVPVDDMIFEFEYPLKEVVTKNVKLLNYPKVMRKGKLVAVDKKDAVKVPFTIEKDSLDMLRYRIKAKWEEDIEYELEILPKTFTNIAFQSNDSLTSKFMVAPKAKSGMITLKTVADSSYKGCFMIQLVQKSGKDEAKIVAHKFVKNVTDEVKFSYLAVGKYRIRVVQDANCNKEWDTGDLVNRKKPEKVRIFADHNNVSEILSKENWDVEVDLDFAKVFEK